VTCLGKYLQIRTINPVGPEDVGEVAAAHFFEQVFGRLGIPTRRAPLAGQPDPKRQSVVATLRGAQREGSVLLLNHSDVVPATGTWTHPPFSGHDDGTYVWGRGALDMKSVGIMQLVAMAILKRANVELAHDVHFVAAADEEVGGRGAEYLAVGRVNEDGTNEGVDPLDLRPRIVLNEGGTGIRDSLLPGRDVYVIGTEEKGSLWTQFAHPEPAVLLRALSRTSVLKPPREDGLAKATERTALQTRCKVAEMISDEAQQVNVQPRLSKITLDCEAGTEARVRQALGQLARSFAPESPPRISISATPSGGRERVAVSIEMGAGGHGSSGVSGTALDVAVAVLISTGQLEIDVLDADRGAEDRFFKYGISAANEAMLANLAREYGETAQSLTTLVARMPGVGGAVLGLAASSLPSDAPFRNTCSFTAFKFPADGEARAKFDCRLTFDTTARALERALAEVVAQDGVVLRTQRAACNDCYVQEFSRSRTDTPEYQTLEIALAKSSASAIASPYMFPASSDSYFFRRAGVPTYGFMPAPLGEAELRTFHAIDERIPKGVLAPAARIYTEVAFRLANEIAPAPADVAHRLGADAMTCRARESTRGGYRWGAVRGPLACEESLYLCTRGAGAPRFVRAVAAENDANVALIMRLAPDYDPGRTEPAEMPSAIEDRLYVPRTGSSTRLYAGQPLEIDTGGGESRSFLMQCATPLHQRLATGFTRAKIHFYRD
jgi:acetylornithine deacetylase/succinyl-diaminopimelate desuccinylase-like protein